MPPGDSSLRTQKQHRGDESSGGSSSTAKRFLKKIPKTRNSSKAK